MDPDSAGLNPAWRKAGLHSVWAGGWPEGTSAEGINAVATLVKQRLDIANKLIPNGGAYFNVTLSKDDLFGDVSNAQGAQVVLVRPGFSTHTMVRF